jgi:hypothetical protein
MYLLHDHFLAFAKRGVAFFATSGIGEGFFVTTSLALSGELDVIDFNFPLLTLDLALVVWDDRALFRSFGMELEDMELDFMDRLVFPARSLKLRLGPGCLKGPFEDLFRKLRERDGLVANLGRRLEMRRLEIAFRLLLLAEELLVRRNRLLYRDKRREFLCLGNRKLFREAVRVREKFAGLLPRDFRAKPLRVLEPFFSPRDKRMPRTLDVLRFEIAVDPNLPLRKGLSPPGLLKLFENLREGS